jgi:hypothetical protein
MGRLPPEVIDAALDAAEREHEAAERELEPPR